MKFHWRMIALGSLWGLLRLVAVAQSVSLEVQPGSIASTSSGFTAQVRVILKNPTAESLNKVSLTPFSNDGIDAKPEKASAVNVGAKSEIEWQVNITVPESSHLPGSVTLEAAYKTAGHEHHVFASLSLSSEGDKKFVEASLDGNLDAVSKERPGFLYVLVTNNMDVPLDAAVQSKGETCEPNNGKEENCSPWANITVFCSQPLRVPAHSVASCKIEVAGVSRVTPGVRPLPVDVDTKWERAGRTEQRHFALTKAVTVGVFFESELLKALSIPSFLVLPGCLIIFTFQLLLSSGWMKLKDFSKIPDLSVTTPGFWVLSISLSGLFAPIYYCATHVNYLLSYGVDDLRNIWISSIPAGMLFYVIIARLTLSHREKYVYSATDNEIMTLKKMGNNKLTVLRPKVSYKLNDKTLSGFLIENIEENQTMVWVSPSIKLEWQNPEDEKVIAWRKEIIALKDGTADAAAIAAVLERAGAAAQLKYESAGSVPNPYHVKVEGLEPQAADYILS